MGSVSLKIGDGTAQFRPRPTLCSSALNLLMLVSVLTTNLFALYAFTSHRRSPSLPPTHHLNSSDNHLSAISDHVSAILRQIDSSKKKLSKIETDLLGFDTVDLSKPDTPAELTLFLTHHPLPLGRDSRTHITHMVSSLAHSCARSRQVLAHYMSYSPFQLCPNDAHLANSLLSRGCDPLPRRRCLSRPAPKPGLQPFPLSLWAPVSEKITEKWNGFDKLMWVKPRGKNDFTVDEVLALGGGRRARTGFDIGGGAGNFAARMAEKGVTVVTSTLNDRNPVSEFVAARGLFPLLITPGQRFPFYDSVFDLVHTSSGLDEGNGGGAAQGAERLEFLMFDIDRVLRAGGLFWLDNYHCVDEKRKSSVTVLIEKFGYKKLKWVVGEKIEGDGSGKKSKAYLSAVLQKPVRR